MTTVMPIDEPRRAGRCSASAPTGVAFLRLNIFSDARRATAGSMRGIEGHEGAPPHPSQDRIQ